MGDIYWVNTFFVYLKRTFPLQKWPRKDGLPLLQETVLVFFFFDEKWIAVMHLTTASTYQKTFILCLIQSRMCKTKSYSPGSYGNERVNIIINDEQEFICLLQEKGQPLINAIPIIWLSYLEKCKNTT